MGKIEKELVEATGVKQKDKEPRQKFLKRLIKACGEMENKKWDAVSEPAQSWHNDNVEARNAAEDADDYEFTEPDGAKAKADDVDEEDAKPVKAKAKAKAEPEEEAEEDEDEKPAKSSKKAKAKEDDEEDTEEEPAPKKKAVKEDDDEDAPVRKAGSTNYFRKLVIKNPNKSMKDLLEKAVAAGYTISRATANTVFSQTKPVLAILVELGKLEAPPAPPAKEKPEKKATKKAKDDDAEDEDESEEDDD